MVQSLVHQARTGVREIDSVNEGLCYLIERVFDPLVECRRRYGDCDHSACTKIGAVMTYVGRNFLSQECMMRDCAFPHLDEHAHEHKRLLDELAALRQARVCGERDRSRVRDLLIRWTAGHVTGGDRALGDWALTRRV